jgi:hypothetical protein
LVPRSSGTPVATWASPTWVVSWRSVLEAAFILLESPSPSRRIFTGSHSLPPSLVRRIGPSHAARSDPPTPRAQAAGCVAQRRELERRLLRRKRRSGDMSSLIGTTRRTDCAIIKASPLRRLWRTRHRTTRRRAMGSGPHLIGGTRAPIPTGRGSGRGIDPRGGRRVARHRVVG